MLKTLPSHRLSTPALGETALHSGIGDGLAVLGNMLSKKCILLNK